MSDRIPNRPRPYFTADEDGRMMLDSAVVGLSESEAARLVEWLGRYPWVDYVFPAGHEILPDGVDRGMAGFMWLSRDWVAIQPATLARLQSQSANRAKEKPGFSSARFRRIMAEMEAAE